MLVKNIEASVGKTPEEKKTGNKNERDKEFPVNKFFGITVG